MDFCPEMAEIFNSLLAIKCSQNFVFSRRIKQNQEKAQKYRQQQQAAFLARRKGKTLILNGDKTLASADQYSDKLQKRNSVFNARGAMVDRRPRKIEVSGYWCEGVLGQNLGFHGCSEANFKFFRWLTM